jgi:hypothetical protein
MRTVVFLVLSSPLALFALPSNCPTSTSNFSGVAIAGAGPGNDLSTINGGGGCAWIDQNLSNFGTGLTTGVSPTTGGVYLFATGTNAITDPVVLTFSTIRGAANVNTDGNNNDGINNFSATSGNGDIEYVDSLNGSPGVGLITQVEVTLNSMTIGLGDELSFTLNVCLDVATTVSTLTSLGCHTAGGTFQSVVFNNFSSGNSNAILTLEHPVSTLAIDNSFNFGGATSFLTLQDSFIQGVPEPPTFGLISAALLTIGLLRRRRNRP